MSSPEEESWLSVADELRRRTDACRADLKEPCVFKRDILSWVRPRLQVCDKYLCGRHEIVLPRTRSREDHYLRLEWCIVPQFGRLSGEYMMLHGAYDAETHTFFYLSLGFLDPGPTFEEPHVPVHESEAATAALATWGRWSARGAGV